MKKIISLFQRNYDTDRLVRNEVVPGAEWVLDGLGTATRKLDGTSCMIDANGTFYKRFDAKVGKEPPKNFIPAQDPDPVTGHWPGWVAVSADNPADKWFVEGLKNTMQNRTEPLEAWTYELIGPHFQSNPEKQEYDVLVKHGSVILPDAPRAFEALRIWFEQHDLEGIVWWKDLSDPNCDKVKIKKRDFGLAWAGKAKK